MKQSVTQESNYGCGIACYAFVRGITYKQAEKDLGEAQAKSERFWIRDLTNELNKMNLKYVTRHIKPDDENIIFTEGTVVLLRRSKRYPVGHYLVRHHGMWMDPWINVVTDNNIQNAKSGFLHELPGIPMYALLPVSI